MICVSITSLRTRALAFLAPFVPSSFSLSLSYLPFRFAISHSLSPRVLSSPSSFFFARPPWQLDVAKTPKGICVSPRRCSKTFMYLLSNDNKRRPAGVMSLYSRVLRDVDADSSRRGKDTVTVSFSDLIDSARFNLNSCFSLLAIFPQKVAVIAL